MKTLIGLLGLLILVNGCGFSVREGYIRSKRPDYLKAYQGGPISSLSKENIQEAIEFGKANKHNLNVILYAFMCKKDVSDLLGDIRNIYVLVKTNYYLIAIYAAKQTRDYKPIDMDYVNFLADLPAFQIEGGEQIVPAGQVTYSYQKEAKFVLLKNGIKVKESNKNPLYKNISPYVSILFGSQTDWQEIANKTIKQTMEMANKIAETYQMDRKIDLDNILTLPANRSNHLYNYEDIDMSSKYEIAVIYKDGEKRVPIDFSSFK